MPDANRYDIEHVSRYLYASSVRHSVMSLCMKPSDGSRQRLLCFDVTTVPPSSLNAETDGFGNTKHVLNIHREHTNLEIVASSTVETTPPRPCRTLLAPARGMTSAHGQGRSLTGSSPVPAPSLGPFPL